MKKLRKILSVLMAVAMLSCVTANVVNAAGAEGSSPRTVAFMFKNLENGLYLDVFGSQGAGAQVIQYHKNENTNQTFYMVSNPTPEREIYAFFPAHDTTTFLSVQNNSGVAGAAVITASGETPAYWDAIYDEAKHAYRIYSASSNYTKCIGPKDGSMDEEVPIVLQDPVDNDNSQYWVLEIA